MAVRRKNFDSDDFFDDFENQFEDIKKNSFRMIWAMVAFYALGLLAFLGVAAAIIYAIISLVS